MILTRTGHSLGYLALVLTAFLSGCTDSAIKEAQNFKIFPNGEFTIKEVLENSQNCNKVKWSSAENSDGRKVVTAICSRKMPEDVVDTIISKKTADFIDLEQTNTKSTRSSYESAREYYLKAGTAINSNALHEAQKTAEALGPAAAELTEEYKQKLSARQNTPPHEQASLDADIRKIRAELDSILPDLAKAEAIISNDSRSQSSQIDLDYQEGHEKITREDLNFYDAKKSEYEVQSKSQVTDLVKHLDEYKKEISTKDYGLSLSFVVLKSSTPQLSEAFYFLGKPEEKQPLGFLPTLLGNPTNLSIGLKDAARLITTKGVDSLAYKYKYLRVKCFAGNQDYC